MKHKIVLGVQKFASDVYPRTERLFRRLAKKQDPEVLFITCSDSRVVPNLITQTLPGELFTSRNAGNLVPKYSECDGSTAAAIEFAVKALQVKQVVVCGHSDCGAMKGLLNPDSLKELPSVARWLKRGGAEGLPADGSLNHLSAAEALTALTEQNVIVQLKNLETHPSVAERLGSGSLHVLGWVYDIEHGQIRTYDNSLKKFVSLHANTRPEAQEAAAIGA